MGLIIRCNDATFTNTVGIAAYPLISALKGLYYLNGSSSDAVKDLSGNENDATMNGSATFSDKVMNITGTTTSNRIATPIVDNNSVAMIALFNPVSTNRALFSTIKLTSPNAGFCFGNNPSNQLVLYADGTFKIVGSATAFSDTSKYYVVGAVITPTSAKIVQYNSNGLRTVASITFSAYVPSSRYVNVCGSQDSYGGNGEINAGLAAFYTGSVSDSEIERAMQFTYEYAKKLGLSLT